MIGTTFDAIDVDFIQMKTRTDICVPMREGPIFFFSVWVIQTHQIGTRWNTGLVQRVSIHRLITIFSNWLHWMARNDFYLSYILLSSISVTINWKFKLNHINSSIIYDERICGPRIYDVDKHIWKLQIVAVMRCMCFTKKKTYEMYVRRR